MLSIKELNEVLSSAGYSNIKVTGTTVVIYVGKEQNKQRAGLTKDLSKKIKGSKYESASKLSSSGHVEYNSFKIVFKVEGGGGSGAGSGVTDVGESAQCYYCAAAWYGEGDFSSDAIRNLANHVQATMSAEDILSKIGQDWRVSCISTARKLYANYHTQFGRKKLIFHRGSSFVNKISSNFSAIAKIDKSFTQINKWSPADIYITTLEGMNTNWNFTTFQEMNAFLLKSINDGNILPVSLKKSPNATLSEINFTKTRNVYRKNGTTVGKKDFFNSKDGYIFYTSEKSSGEIQFRSSLGSTWQGEIKGKNANHGKISGGPLRLEIQNFFKTQLSTQTEIASRVGPVGKRKSTSPFYKSKFYPLYKSVVQDEGTKALPYNDWYELIKSKPPDWVTSKYLSCEIIDVFNKGTQIQQNTFLTKIINYAKSESTLSAPYVKSQ